MPEGYTKADETSLAATTLHEQCRRAFAAALFDQGVSGKVRVDPGQLTVEAHFILDTGAQFLLQGRKCSIAETADDQSFLALLHAHEEPLTVFERRLSDWRHIKGWCGRRCPSPVWSGRPAELAAEAVAAAKAHKHASGKIPRPVAVG